MATLPNYYAISGEAQEIQKAEVLLEQAGIKAETGHYAWPDNLLFISPWFNRLTWSRSPNHANRDYREQINLPTDLPRLHEILKSCPA